MPITNGASDSAAETVMLFAPPAGTSPILAPKSRLASGAIASTQTANQSVPKSPPTRIASGVASAALQAAGTKVPNAPRSRI